MKQISILLFILLMFGCKQDEIKAELPLKEDSRDGAKLFSGFYENMSHNEFGKVVTICKNELNYNFSTYEMVFDDKSKIEYRLDPNFKNDSLYSITLSLIGDSIIDTRYQISNDPKEEIISNSKHSSILSLYKNKYGSPKIETYTKSFEILNPEGIKFKKYLWLNDSISINYDCEGKTITYCSRKVFKEKEEKAKKLADSVNKQEQDKILEQTEKSKRTLKNI